jgi:acyl-CoA synthetase (NDP forming)
MKVMSDDIVHKFDVGGVMLNINSKEEVSGAYETILKNVETIMPEATIEGISISEQVAQGVEVILGIKKDPSFGSVIMFGVGGIFVEIFKDVSFRVAPVQKDTAFEMINEIKASKLLLGTRGKKPADIDSIIESIVKLSHMAVDNPNIKELDINPLIVLEQGKGCFIADAKIILK